MPSDMGTVYLADVESVLVSFESDPQLKLTVCRDELPAQFPDVDLKFDQLAIKVRSAAI